MRPLLYNRLWSRRGSGGESPGTVLVSDQNFSDTEEASQAVCSITFGNDRTIAVAADETPSESHWVDALGTASNYDIRVSPTTGTFSSGSASVNTWLNLGTSRLWQVTKGGASSGSKACTATYEIRDAVTLTLRETATITLTATVTL